MLATTASDDPFTTQINALIAQVAQRDVVIQSLTAQLESFKQQLLNLRRIHFGASSEKLPGQAELFAEVIDLPVPPKLTQQVTYERNRPGRPALPKDLPRTRIDYDLSDAEKAEFDSLEQIGEECSETLEYTPAKLQVIVHARAKYVCKKDGESTIRTAAAQPSPLPKSNAGAGLLAHILVSVFADHLPLNRQENMFKRDGFIIPRSTLCEWKLGAAELLEVLIAPLTRHLLAAPRVHADDTTMPLLEKGRGSTKTARLWGYLGAGARRKDDGEWVEHAPAVVFEFTQSRESKHPIRFLKGYSGYLQADAYSGFDVLYRDGSIIEVACLAHCRRKFFEVAKTQATPSLAAQAVAWIAKLYEIESSVRGKPPDEILAVRQTQSIPVLADFKIWLDGHYPTLLPQGPLGKAFAYARNHWEALVRYTEDGVLLPDNNRLESALRPIAIGRKNYMFAGSERGGRAAAIMYSLIGTAKLNGVEPFSWLKDVLTRLPSHPINRVDELLPFNWKPAH